MGYKKMVLGSSYHSRYQVKYRRRRSGQTDYQNRRNLVIQDKNKYATPKHRLVVRFTNTKCICQIVYSTLMGDIVVASAESTELKRYGLTCGLKNYPAAYCTGLLVGRRVLQKLGLDEKYTGTGNDLPEDEVTGLIEMVEFNKRKYFVDELDEERRPFRCFLDVGLARTTLGARVFGALKGCSDAGVDIPHNHKKFPGYDADEKSYDAEMHKERIFGVPIMEFMEKLIEDDAESGTDKFSETFPSYKKAGIGPDDLEDLYLSVHKKIREDPAPAQKETAKARAQAAGIDSFKKRPKNKRLSPAERKARVQAKLDKIAAMEEDSEESDEE